MTTFTPKFRIKVYRSTKVFFSILVITLISLICFQVSKILHISIYCYIFYSNLCFILYIFPISYSSHFVSLRFPIYLSCCHEDMIKILSNLIRLVSFLLRCSIVCILFIIYCSLGGLRTACRFVTCLIKY